MPSNEYRVCPQCSNYSLTHERQHFCVWCGTKLVGECQQCGKPILHPHGRFCYHCGSRYGFAQVPGGSGRRIVSTSESAMKTWVSQERQLLGARVVPSKPFLKQKP